MDIISLSHRIKAEIPSLDLRLSEEMRAHTSFRIGGPAAALAVIKNPAELSQLLKILSSEGIKAQIIGRGTNLLVSDAGLSDFVIKISAPFDNMKVIGTSITAQSGASLSRLAVFAQQKGLSGLEFAHGIPGTLGGAIFMNAGAYGGEMRDVVTSVRCMSANGEIFECRGEELNFSYRYSRFAERSDIIYGAVLRLTPQDKDEILETMNTLQEKRSESQPLAFPSAGSTFKRPKSGYAAAMIDGAGLKGFRIGGASVSEKHAGFVINDAGATFEDVTALMAHIQKTVLEKYGVELEPEVKILK